MPSELPSFPLRFSIAGAGRVATSVGVTLAALGHHPSSVWSRSPSSVARATDLIGCSSADLSDLATDADLVLIGVEDEAIADVASELAEHVNASAVYAHFAGSLGIEPLASLALTGARVAALHPVQSCPSIEAAVARLPGSAWGVTCAEDLQPWAHRLVGQGLLGKAVTVAGTDRPAWHAAAVSTSNGIAAVLAVGESILGSLAIDPSAVLLPLAQGTLDNAASSSGGETLTGPAVRGETTTIERHLSALRSRPELADAYRAVAVAIVAGAVVSGRISPGEAAPIRAVLERS